MTEYVVLVDEDDRAVGTAEKGRAHAEGLLHRALSVFVFDERGRMLLQQRHTDKYHSGGLWSNACCSHPRPGEAIAAAAARRLEEEMGLRCPLAPAFTFTYHVRFDERLYENEFDHVFIGVTDRDPMPNPSEVDAWQWIEADRLEADVEAHPERYTYWFRMIYRRVLARARRAGLLER